MASLPIQGRGNHRYSWTCLDCKISSPERLTKEWSEKDWQDHIAFHRQQLDDENAQQKWQEAMDREECRD